jgi:hypothetical protein
MEGIRITTGDFNGDGRTDILRQAVTSWGGQLSVYLSNGDGTFTPTYLGPSWDVQGIAITTGDFNGDGKTDILRQAVTSWGGQLSVYLSNGDGTFTSTDLGPSWDVEGITITTGDFNGDGKTDVLRQAVTSWGGQLSVYLSNGDGTFTPSYLGAGWDREAITILTGDLNGDGKTDIVRQAVADWGGGVSVLLSSGDGTFASTYFGGGWDVQAITVLTGDFNGDGKTDLLRQAISSWGGQAQVVFSTPAGTSPDQLASIANGAGPVTAFTYLPLTATSIYTKDAGALLAATYPQVDLQPSFYAVSSVSSSNGLGGTIAASYQYGGLKLSLDGRGLLGFRWLESTDQQTGMKGRTEFRQDWPYVGLPSLVKKTQSSGAVLTQATNAYSCTNPASGAACSLAAGNRYFPFLSQGVETGADLNGASLPTVTTTSSGLDLYGNVGAVTVSTGDGYSKTTTNIYSNDVANWRLGRLTRSTVSSTSP